MTSTQKEIKEALEKATPGPWKGKHAITPYITVSAGVVDEVIATVSKRNDLQLLSNAPTWLLHQQELIEQKDAEIERLNAARIGVTKTKTLIINSLHETKAHQAEEIRKLREALEYIANQHVSDEVEDWIEHVSIEATILDCVQERARSALSQLTPIKGEGDNT